MGITYIITTSQVGQLLVAGTSRGVCAVKLGDSNEILEQELQCEYPSTLTLKKCVTRNKWADLLAAYLKGEVATLDLPLDIQATDFQWSVWQYLRTIPWGKHVLIKGSLKQLVDQSPYALWHMHVLLIPSVSLFPATE